MPIFDYRIDTFRTHLTSSGPSLDIQTLHTQYLQEGTGGYAVIRKFHSRYSDVTAKIGIVEIDDLVHDILLSLSKTDLSEVQKMDHYVLRAIKLRCWTLLDKALRHKAFYTPMTEPEREDTWSEETGSTAAADDQLEAINGMELIGQVNLFKAQLRQGDVLLLNYLLDDADRADMAQHLGVKLNTLDTHIRRLRIRLADFLKRQGYTYAILDRFNSFRDQ